jgi:transcriptional repressor NrdR
MVCIYCGGDTQVTNSRLQKRANTVWRRRKCLECGAIWTSLEAPEARSAFRVIKNESMHEFSPETLMISLYEALRHRKTAVTDAAALTHTVLSELYKKRVAALSTADIKKTAHAVLSRFDKTAAAVYQERTS